MPYDPLKKEVGGIPEATIRNQADCIPPQHNPFEEIMPTPRVCPTCGSAMLVCLTCTGKLKSPPDYIGPFYLTEAEMRAIVRQTFNQYIPTEGTSGPVLHKLLDRIKTHVGKDKYDAFTAEPVRGGKHG